MGSIMSLSALLFFIFLLWEALRAQRALVSSGAPSTALEWQVGKTTPPARHTFNQLPKVMEMW